MVVEKNIDKVKTRLLEQARLLPTRPGCYLMKNKRQQIIYVGKAKNLKNRVQSYFQASVKSVKTEVMVGHIESFDFVMTETEVEALVLENNLIKQHSPKYNIRLRDDKSYPYVVINHEEPFPRLEYQRRVKRGPRKEVYGPFVVGSRISQVLKVLTKSFGLRDCSLHEFRSRKKPCLLYQMHQCHAPCVELISASEYARELELAASFLRGRGQETLKALEQRMLTAAEQERFELAAQLRDHLSLLTEFLAENQQKHAELERGDENLDVMAFYFGEGQMDVAVCLVRNGLMLGHKNFHFEMIESEDSLQDHILSFIMEYYTSSHDGLPEKLYLSDEQVSKENQALLEEGLKGIASVKVSAPPSKLASLWKLTYQQAHENQRFRFSQEEGIQLALIKLQELLKLKEKPKRIECFDVAIFQGGSPTAAQIVFENGRPKREAYRHYHLEERPEGNNDFAMMREILSRRLKHEDWPDLLIVDGGVGQVNSFLGVLKEAEVEMPVAGIAKAKTKRGFSEEKVERSQERLIIPGRANPYILDKHPQLMKLIVQMRDEAHRFSRRLHHGKESKRVLSSWLDQVPGIGPQTKKKILSRWPLTQEQAALESVETLAERWELSVRQVKKIKDYLDQFRT